MDAPEYPPIGNAESGETQVELRAKLKEVKDRLVAKVKAKVSPARQTQAENYLDRPLPEEPAKRVQSVKENLTLFKSLVSASSSEVNRTEIKTVVADIAQEAADILAKNSQSSYMGEALAETGQKVDETSALPLGRYLDQVIQKDILTSTDPSAVQQRVELLCSILLEQSDITPQQLKSFVALIAADVSANRFQLGSSEMRAIRDNVHSLVMKGADIKDFTKVYQEWEKNKRDVDRENLDREGDDVVRKFTAGYKEVETAILEDLSLDDGKKRQVMYDILEIDIDDILNRMKVNQSEEYREGVWSDVEKEYLAKCRKYGLSADLQNKWQAYFRNFREAVKIKQKFMANYSPSQGSFRFQGEDLRAAFHLDAYDSSLLAFMFFESSDKDAKDIYTHFKIKSFMEHNKHGHHAQEAALGANGHGAVGIDYHAMENYVFGDLKRIYINQAAFRMTGTQEPQAFGMMTRRLDDIMTLKEFSTSSPTNPRADIRFLGGIAGESNITKRVAVLSSGVSEVMTQSSERGVSTVQQGAEDANHQNMGDLMQTFGTHVREVVHLAGKAGEFKKSIASGNAENIGKIASEVTNFVLSKLTSESPVILLAMAQRMDTFRMNVAMADGQIRPSFFGVNDSSMATPQDLEMFRSITALYPEQEENVARVYGAMAEMLMWSIGDILPQLARYLPPMKVETPNLGKRQAELNERIAELKKQPGYESLKPYEKAKKEMDLVKWFYKHRVRRKLSTTFYDEYARGLLQQANPILFLLWGKMREDTKVQHMLFAGGYNIEEDAKPETTTGKIGYKLKRAFQSFLPYNSHKTLTDPLEILHLYDDELTTLSDGMTTEVLRQRLEGKWPMMYRLTQLVPGLGMGERGGWRDDAVQLNALLAKYFSQTENFNPYTFVDLGMQVGPRTATLIVEKLGTFSGLKADPEFNKFLLDYVERTYGLKGHDAVKKAGDVAKDLKKYVYNMAYEQFPSLFVMRPDFRRFTHQEDRVFMEDWRYDILTKYRSEGPNGLCNMFLAEDGKRREEYVTAMKGSWADFQKDEIDSRIIQQNMLEGMIVLEKFVMHKRNEAGVTEGVITQAMGAEYVPPTLRGELSELIKDLDKFLQAGYTSAKHKAFKEDGATAEIRELHTTYTNFITRDSAFRTLQKFLQLSVTQHGLPINSDNELRVMRDYAHYLFQTLYGGKSEGVKRTITANGQVTLNTEVSRGLLDGAKYYDLGQASQAAREKKVSLIDLMQGVERKFTGPVFDMYYENFGLKDPTIYNPQILGAPDSGKSVDVRMFADFQKQLAGLKEFNEATEIMEEAVRAQTTKEYEAAEDAYLKKAQAMAVKTVFSYNPPGKKYEVGAHMVEMWLLMGRTPGKLGADIKYGGALSRQLLSGKSLAEIANREHGFLGLNKLGSEFHMDVTRMENFIFKAVKLGLLPPSSRGEDVDKKAQPLKEVFAKSLFKKIDKELEDLEIKANDTTIPEKERLTWWEKQKLSFYHVAEKVGAMHPFGLGVKYKDDVYAFNAKRIKEGLGLNNFKGLLQFGVYFAIAIAAITLIAVQQGSKELDSKK